MALNDRNVGDHVSDADCDRVADHVSHHNADNGGQHSQHFDGLRLVFNALNNPLNVVVRNMEHNERHSERRIERDNENDNDVPNELSSAYSYGDSCESLSSNYTELRSSMETSGDRADGECAQPCSACRSTSGSVWNMNYHESAIYLEEGFNNDKLDFHPRSRSTLPAYLVVHNSYFYCLDMFAALLLLSLALLEKPAVNRLNVNEGIHASLELLALSIVAIELFMKYRWMRVKHFVRHTRTLIKSIVLIIMISEALVVLIRQDSHFRVTRALRPFFLIDNHYCGGIRRVIRQILQSLPPFIDMLFLLFFFMLVFAILGFYLFSNNVNDVYFSSLGKSFVSLFVLLTSANFPDVMMPSYSNNRISSLFFIAFLVINLYFLMNIMLAVVYEAFTRIEKDKFRKLYLHRRKACQHAFRLLVTRLFSTRISFKHFEGLMRYYKPRASKLDIYLMFKVLDADKSGYLTLNEFYKVYFVSQLKWERKSFESQWFDGIRYQCIRRTCAAIHNLVIHPAFNVTVFAVIALSAIYQVIEAVLRTNQTVKSELQFVESSQITLIFVSLYGIEASLKLIGFGVFCYFNNGWNIYDFCITALAIVGLIGEGFGVPFSFVFVLRSLKLLKLMELKTRYKDIMSTFLFIIIRRFGSVFIVVLIVYYFFGIIGMELFSSYDLMNCCKNSTVEQYFAFSPNSSLNGYYYLNNFDNLVISYVTLFELMVVNNWFILMEAFAIIVSDWSRIYFMTFYIMTLVVITIVVAFVLEAFLFRMQYSHVMGDIDKDTMVTIDVTLSQEELNFCYGRSSRSLNITHLLRFSDDLVGCESGDVNPITYHGSRTQTKFSFSTKMYDEEIKEWSRKADEEEREKRRVADDCRHYSRISRRAHSCSS